MTTNTTQTTIADELRWLADLCEADDVVARHVAQQFAGVGLYVPVIWTDDDKKAVLRAFARAGKRAGAEVTKDYSDNWLGVHVTYGDLTLYVYAAREAVCERVSLGVEVITKLVPDPDALAAVPQVEVTEEVEQYEWTCPPLLAEEDDS